MQRQKATGLKIRKTVGLVISLAVLGALLVSSSAVSVEHRWEIPLSGVVEFQPPPLDQGIEKGLLKGKEVGPNIRVNSDNQGAHQNETTISTNPTNPLNMIGGANDYRNGEVDAGWYATLDGGQTWFDGTLGDFGMNDAQGDPAIAVDAEGNFYFCYIDFDRGSPDNGIFVCKTTDGGVTWTGPYTVISHQGNPNAPFEDKCYIAADRTGSPYSNNVYITWTHFYTGEYPIQLSRSTDGGQTFSTPIDISHGSQYNQGSCPAVGPDGEVYVAWHNYSDIIEITKSTDGGISFSDDVTIAHIVPLPSPLPPTQFRVNSFPSLDIDISGGSYNGYIYAVWADYGTGDGDIHFSRSTDGGATWSSPRRLNDDEIYNGKDQFFPWLSVDNQGNLDVMFYDRRNCPGNHDIDVYWTRSTDGGITFSPNELVTTERFDPDIGFSGTFIGDYNGITNWSGSAFPLWTDTRLGDQDPFTARCFSSGVTMSCNALTPTFCRGHQFYFQVTTINSTGGPVNTVMIFGGYVDYGCDPGNVLVTIPRNRTIPEGTNTTNYYFKVPNAVAPGDYSASIGFDYGGNSYLCCMDLTIVNCGPWMIGGNAEWDVVETDRGDLESVLPQATTLAQNYPNPFNAETRISYTLVASGNVSLKVYDISGQLVATLVDGYQEAGEYVATWEASRVSSGVYFYRLEASDITLTRKMNLLK
jgi:hypothetical protein